MEKGRLDKILKELKELVPVKVVPCLDKRFPVSLDYKIYGDNLHHILECLELFMDNSEDPYIIYGIYEDFVGLGAVRH